MPLPEKMQRLFEIAEQITHGPADQQKDHLCPYCGESRLIYSFTRIHILPDGYGLFLLCPNCKNSSHFTLSGRPPNFKEEMVLPGFQKLED
jgi:hypothetical protein